MERSYFFLIILGCSFSFIQSFEGSEDVFNSLPKSRIERVDIGVKRPVRFCQGFEDPAEIDCYMRSEVKSYVCTEPVTFNPCESLERVETYHYDHILHRCVRINVPACEGQIIRVLTLLQCLVYCHNKDPFSLGKSRSMVYKLNQPKPYIPPEQNEEEKEKLIGKQDNSMNNQNSEVISEYYKTLDLVNKKPESAPNKKNDGPNMNPSNGEKNVLEDSNDMYNVLIKLSVTIKPPPGFHNVTVAHTMTTKKQTTKKQTTKKQTTKKQTTKKQNTEKQTTKIQTTQMAEEIIMQDYYNVETNIDSNPKEPYNKNNRRVNDKNEKKIMMDLRERKTKQITENLAKRYNAILKNFELKHKGKKDKKKEKKMKLDETLKTDSKDQSTDYGFYLWDE